MLFTAFAYLFGFTLAATASYFLGPAPSHVVIVLVLLVAASMAWAIGWLIASKSNRA
jgi:hypothetical protein